MANPGIYGLAALAAVFWGANFNLAAPVLADLPPLEAAAGRFTLAALIMVAITLWRREGLAMLATARRHGGALSLLGLVGIAGFNLLFFDAMRTTSAVNGALVMATNPLLTALLAAVSLGEKPSARQIQALPLALAGVAVVILGGGREAGAIGIGDLEMLGADLAWAAYNVLSRRLMPAGAQFANVTVVMAAGAAVLLVAAGIDGATLALPGPKASAALLAMAGLGSVLAYLFWSQAIARIGAGRTALFMNVVPVAATLIATLGGAWPSGAQLAGGGLVIASVVYAMLPSRPKAAVVPAEAVPALEGCSD